MKRLLSLVFLVLPLLSFATDWNDIQGKNSYGDQVSVRQNFNAAGEPIEPFLIVDFFDRRDGKEKQISCKFFTEERQAAPNLSCQFGGNSAGGETVYIERYDKCGGAIYLCKKGCNKAVPRRMYQAPWEGAC